MEPVNESPPSPKPRRRFRRWLKRFALVVLVLVVILTIFHRPIILSLVRWGGTKGAALQGLELTWEVEGSVWNGLELHGVKAVGGDDHWLPKATLGKLSVNYDMRADLEHIVKGLTLHDLEAEVDLRHLPASKVAKKPEEAKKNPGKAPPLIWPGFIDLKNANAKITLGNGKQITVRGLTLQVGTGMPGIFECQELRVEPGGPAFQDLSAKIDWQPRLIVIREFTLPMDVVLDELRVDLKGYETGHFITQILAHLGAAKLKTDADIAGVFGETMQAKADMQVTDLRAEELQTLGLPKSVTFDGGRLDLHVEGDPRSPPNLKAALKTEVANIRAAGAMIDKVSLALEVADGKATLSALNVTRGSNLIDVTAQAQLPANIAEWQKTTWTSVAKASITDVSQLLAKPPPVSGTVTLDATAEGLGATPTKLSGTVNGDTLAFQNYRLPKLGTQFSLDGKEARLEIPALALGEGNQLSFKASMLMQDAMPVNAQWSLKVEQPAKLIETLTVPGTIKAPPKEVTGKLNLSGQTNFAVNDLSAGALEKLGADISLDLKEAKYGEGPLPEIALKAQVKEGKVYLNPCSIRVDEQNHLELTADMGVKPPYGFAAKGDITLPQVIKLNTLLASFGAPQIKSGSVFSHLDARGEIQPWKCEGTATLTATKVHPASLPQPADVTLDASFAGKRADLKSLEAKLGLWKLALKGVVDDKSAALTQLKVWQKDTLLVEGQASSPFDIMQPGEAGDLPADVMLKAKDLRVNEVLAAAGIQNIPEGILNADISLKGRLKTLVGDVKINLREVKAPKAPKAFTPATIDLTATLNGNQVKANLKALQPPLQPLTVEAQLPLDVSAVIANPSLANSTPIKVTVRMEESDLSFIRDYAPDTIRSIPAKLKINADVSGTVGKPLINADVDLHVEEVSWAKANMPSVRDVKVHLSAKDRILTIDDISVLVAGGHVKLGGTVNATDMANPALNVSVKASEALVFRDPTSSLRANADVSCVGTLKQARVAGTVQTVRGRIFKEIDLLPMLKLPADVPPVPENTQRSTAKLELPPMLKDWTFDVRVTSRDPVLISGNLANGAVSVDASLRGTGAAPLLNGGANIDRLILKLPFSVVRVTRGVVTLNPQKPFDPELDIRGESRVGSNEIILYIYGDSTNPKTRFTSTPPMSEPDIVTLLSTGTTLGGDASELAAEAASRAAFLFISELYRKAFKKKKVVREDPPKLHVTFNPSGADRSNDSVQAAYDLTDHWRLSARFTQTGRMKALLGYVLRFGKAAQATDEPVRETVRPIGQTVESLQPPRMAR